jgi:hypothetical protein
MPDEPGQDQPEQTSAGPKRGRGAGAGGGALSELLRRRVEEAAKAAERRRPEAERAVRAAAEQAKRAGEAARPELERRARQARAAAKAVTPHVERAAGEAARYAQEHRDELLAAAAGLGKQALRAGAPAPLRPAIDALDTRPRRQPEEPPLEGEAERS